MRWQYLKTFNPAIMKLRVTGSTVVNVQVPVLGGLIITAEVGIFLLLACFSSPEGGIF